MTKALKVATLAALLAFATPSLAQDGSGAGSGNSSGTSAGSSGNAGGDTGSNVSSGQTKDCPAGAANCTKDPATTKPTAPAQ